MFVIIELTGKPQVGNPVLRLERVVRVVAGIYKITNLENGKVYIGGTTNLRQRKIDHFKLSTLNSHRAHLPLYQDIKKFGKEKFVFEVIKYCDEEDLVRNEERYLDKIKGSDHYNVVHKALNMHDEEFLQEHSRRLSERNEQNWGKSEYREQMIATFKKGSNKRGAIMRNYNETRWKDPQKRKEMERLLSENRKKIFANPENAAKAIEGLNKYTNSIKLPVGQYDQQGNLVATFEGVREAERAMGLPNDTIGKVCRGVKYRKSAAGFTWKYLDK